jgi:ABC-2 type transport system permease protein
VKRRLKSPLTILVLLVTPILMTAIMGAIFAPRAEKSQFPKIKMLLVDKDKNIGSRLFLGSLSSNQLKEMFELTLVDELEGKKLISQGKASALVIIPENFTESLIKARKSQFIVIKNPSQQFLPNVVEEFMNTYGVIISGFVQVFGPEIKAVDLLMQMDIEKISEAAMVHSIKTGKSKIQSLKKYLDPLLIQLKEETTGNKEEKEKSDFNIFSFILPGISIMFLLFVVEIFVRDILTEREDGKLQRMMFAPVRPWELILARIFSGWILGVLSYILIVVVGGVLFNISWGNYGYLFLLIAVTCFWIAAFFSLLNAFFKNKNQAGAITAPIIMVFSAFGGSIVQVDQLPKGVNWVANFTINHWFIQGIHQIRDGLLPVLSLVIIFITGIILLVMASIFLKKRITI